jgi:hypothetical protein
MTALDPRVTDRLAKICAMLGSNHDGERASAALVADRILKASGLTWADFFSSSRASLPESLPELCGWLLAHAEVLNSWEADFLRTIRAPLSVKQRDKLDSITRKVRAYTEGRA